MRRFPITPASANRGLQQVIVIPRAPVMPVPEECPECPICPEPGVAQWVDIAPIADVTLGDGSEGVISYADGLYTINGISPAINSEWIIETERVIDTNCRIVPVSPSPFPYEIFNYLSSLRFSGGLQSVLWDFEGFYTRLFVMAGGSCRIAYEIGKTDDFVPLSFRIQYLNTDAD